jgi:tRNA A-37 threonylcarbamoyl transferase component Bud32
MLSATSIARVESSSGWRDHRVELLSLPEGDVVVKGQRPPRGPWRFRLLAMLAKLTRNPLLRPVPAPGGAASQATEIRRLQTLRAAGVNVPEVLHQAPDYFVMRRIQGPSLGAHFSAQPEQALQAVARGLHGLLALHAAGQYLSQGFARNILEQDGALWFIDFEDDPLLVMDLPDAQARDLLAFMLSVVWTSRADRKALQLVWRQACQQMQPAVLARVRQASSGLAWLRHLPTERKPWGRDVVTVQALAAFLSQWLAQESASH